jgi:hypothetical protein
MNCRAMLGQHGAEIEGDVARLSSFRYARRVALASALLGISCNESCTCTSNTFSRSDTAPAASEVPGATPTGSAQLSSDRPVSILQIIAQPELFHGARVQVVGFVSIEREGTALYLHKEDFLEGLTANAVWLDLERARVNLPQKSGYTIVEGRFDPTQHGHMGMFAAGIDQIDRLSPMPSRADFAPPPRAPTFDAGPLPSAMPRK